MAKVPVTVTLDEDVVEQLKAKVASGEAPSVSAFVLEALRERLANERITMHEFVEEMLRGQPPLTEEERAWARAAFDEAKAKHRQRSSSTPAA